MKVSFPFGAMGAFFALFTAISAYQIGFISSLDRQYHAFVDTKVLINNAQIVAFSLLFYVIYIRVFFLYAFIPGYIRGQRTHEIRWRSVRSDPDKAVEYLKPKKWEGILDRFSTPAVATIAILLNVAALYPILDRTSALAFTCILAITLCLGTQIVYQANTKSTRLLVRPQRLVAYAALKSRQGWKECMSLRFFYSTIVLVVLVNSFALGKLRYSTLANSNICFKAEGVFNDVSLVMVPENGVLFLFGTTPPIFHLDTRPLHYVSGQQVELQTSLCPSSEKQEL